MCAISSTSPIGPGGHNGHAPSVLRNHAIARDGRVTLEINHARYFVENLWIVWLANFLPGSRTVDGKAGLFGESG